MKLYFEIEAIERDPIGTSVALGTFDGLHIGHMEIINYTKEAALEKGLKSFVYTFSNHPRELLTPDHAPPKIMDIDEKVQIFTRAEVDYLALIKFDEAQMAMTPEHFIESILIDKLNVKHLTVGYDYRFGKEGKGDVNLLKSFANAKGFTLDVVSPIMRNDVRVSSSLIRRLLEQGRVEEANFYLGRHHFIKGEVVRGKGKGKDLGFPTANLKIKEHISAIGPGVYITETHWKGKTYPSATNVGFNPTYAYTGLHMETFIEGIDQAMYGEVIEVHFIKRLRDEKKFHSELELIEAMHIDIEKMRLYFKEKNVLHEG